MYELRVPKHYIVHPAGRKSKGTLRFLARVELRIGTALQPAFLAAGRGKLLHDRIEVN